jgi:hypothetical protein
MKRNFLQTNKFSTTNENFPNPKILRPLDRTLHSELEAPPRPLAKSSVERVFKFQNATESSPTNFDFSFLRRETVTSQIQATLTKLLSFCR